MIVTPGKVFATDGTDNVTLPKLNALGLPSVALETDEVKSDNIESLDGSKVTDIPVKSLDDSVQAKFGFKNYLPYPDFVYWKFGTTIALSTSGQVCDGWAYSNAGGVSGNIERVAITPAESDTLLRDSKYWMQIATSSVNATGITVSTAIPNARLFSGQKLTISFVGRVFSGTVPAISARVTQYFGSGGSPSANVSTDGSFDVQPGIASTRCSVTLDIPTVSGKTFGTNGDDFLNVILRFANSSTTYTVGLAAVQAEFGDTATTFENSISRKSGFDLAFDIRSNPASLSLTEGVAYMSSSVSAATSVRIVPAKSDRIALYAGTFGWNLYKFQETAISLSALAANGVWDIFAYSNGSVALFETLAWTSQTARATALARYDGVLCKAGDPTRRYVGSFATTDVIGQTEWLVGGSASRGSPISLLLYWLDMPDFSFNSKDTDTWGAPDSNWRNVGTYVSSSVVTAYNYAKILNGDRLSFSMAASWISATDANTYSVSIAKTSGTFSSSVPAITTVSNPNSSGAPMAGSARLEENPALGVTQYWAIEKMANASASLINGSATTGVQGILVGISQ